MAWFVLTTGLLAAALWIPASRLVWTLSVRRLERRAKRRLDAAEIAGQKRRAGFIAFLVVVPFAFLFNFWLLSPDA